jgi:FKBP-type peptidyl-prolyl cis-trans isomerase FkpA
LAKRDKKQRSKGSAGNNRKSGDDFLKNNHNKDGVIETDSGLQYLIVEETNGNKPICDSIVTIHQRALLLNGSLLEDTYRQNKPDEVNINELIEGLQEGLQLMTKGSRFKFWVPSNIAWGRKGTGNKIPPNAVLFFDIRLIDFY